ncbi:MAG: cupredoxin domain-containing protein [Mariprofundus sp.]|nr:cupredoxin domain-containing protein [Mariprofundus sp.]
MTLHFTMHRLTKATALCLVLCLIAILPSLAVAAQYEISIENHQFVPSELEVSADQKHRLIIINKDATPEEFESYELNREKIVAGNSQIIIFLPPLEAGIYPFFGEFHEATAQGRIIVK